MHLVKQFFLLTFLSLINHCLCGQVLNEPTRPKNSVYINILGDASLISGNYERLVLSGSTPVLTFKGGLGYNEEFKLCWGSCSPPARYLTIPHHFTGLIGKQKYFFEIGIGGTAIIGNTNDHYLLYPIIGFRILPVLKNKFNFRIYGEIPFTGLARPDILFVPVGLSIGKTF